MVFSAILPLVFCLLVYGYMVNGSIAFGVLFFVKYYGKKQSVRTNLDGLLGVMHVVTSHLELTRLLSIWIVLLGNIVPTQNVFFQKIEKMVLRTVLASLWRLEQHSLKEQSK